jgi:hypothetical protein
MPIRTHALAKFDKGVLTLTVPKQEQQRTVSGRLTPCRAARVLTGSVPARARTAIILRSLAASFTVAAQADSFIGVPR